MNYKRIYDDIIHHRQMNPIYKYGPGYIKGSIETHHIIPKCLGGTNDNSNLINVYTREHYVLHLLLTKIYNNDKLRCAVIKMNPQGKSIRFNSRLYKSIRQGVGEYTGRRLSKVITWNGEQHTYKEWSELTGISAKAISNRLNDGWCVDDALSKPMKNDFTFLIDGKLTSLKQIALDYNIKYKTLSYRIRNMKMTLDEALKYNKSESITRQIDAIDSCGNVTHFKSFYEAYKYAKTNLNISTKTALSNNLNGYSKSCGGFVFRYCN